MLERRVMVADMRVQEVNDISKNAVIVSAKYIVVCSRASV
jgi:hypothetical protein